MSRRGVREYGTRPWQVVALVALAVAVVAMAGYTVMRDPEPPPSGVTYTPPPPSPEPVTLSAVFVGDSYTQGVGSSWQAERGFAPLVADRLGWDATVLGETGTAYISDGSQYTGWKRGFTSYVDRVSKVPKDADIVIVSGGRNDFVGDVQADDVLPAAEQFIKAVQRRAPEATLVVVAPFWNNAQPPQPVLDFRDGLSELVDGAGAVFIDPLAEQWITDDNAAKYIGKDGLHPNDAGHAYLARRLAGTLERAGVSAG